MKQVHFMTIHPHLSKHLSDEYHTKLFRNPIQLQKIV